MKNLLAIRIEPEMKNEIKLISKVLHTTESEWIRNKLAYDIKEDLGTLKTQIALAYAQGEITKKELREVFGKLAEDIEFTLTKVKEEFKDAKKLAKKLKNKN